MYSADGIMVILSSPSGAGKTTLTKLISEKKNFEISISYTTRKPRSNEKNGKDYFFISNEEFKNLIKHNKLLEHAKVFNNFYGTNKIEIISKLKRGTNILFDIDWQGTKQIKESKLPYRLITFFVLPPSKETLKKRLSNRDMKDKLIVEERMQEFDKDLLHWTSYDFVVINDDLDKCFNEISNIIDSIIHNNENQYDSEKIKKHVELLLG